MHYYNVTNKTDAEIISLIAGEILNSELGWRIFVNGEALPEEKCEPGYMEYKLNGVTYDVLFHTGVVFLTMPIFQTNKPNCTKLLRLLDEELLKKQKEIENYKYYLDRAERIPELENSSNYALIHRCPGHGNRIISVAVGHESTDGIYFAAQKYDYKWSIAIFPNIFSYKSHSSIIKKHGFFSSNVSQRLFDNPFLSTSSIIIDKNVFNYPERFKHLNYPILPDYKAINNKNFFPYVLPDIFHISTYDKYENFIKLVLNTNIYTHLPEDLKKNFPAMHKESIYVKFENLGDLCLNLDTLIYTKTEFPVHEYFKYRCCVTGLPLYEMSHIIIQFKDNTPVINKIFPVSTHALNNIKLIKDTFGYNNKLIVAKTHFPVTYAEVVDKFAAIPGLTFNNKILESESPVAQDLIKNVIYNSRSKPMKKYHALYRGKNIGDAAGHTIYINRIKLSGYFARYPPKDNNYYAIYE